MHLYSRVYQGIYDLILSLLLRPPLGEADGCEKLVLLISGVTLSVDDRKRLSCRERQGVWHHPEVGFVRTLFLPDRKRGHGGDAFVVPTGHQHDFIGASVPDSVDWNPLAYLFLFPLYTH